jgi:hypothetical protein
MKRFKNYIAEEVLTEDKNLHMTHLEDAVLDGGVVGTRNVINYLRALRDMLGGNTKAPVNVSVKWDGAPAIFAGKDPSDGKFFIAKKGVFNKNPKIYKTEAEIDNDISGDLASKFKVALKEFSKLGIEGVVQGDFLYTNDDLQTTAIDGESYITFHPNTIVYAVPTKSKLAKTISGSSIGVVFHTTYRGDSFETMSASFGKEIVPSLKKVKSVWAVDAVFEDKSGNATFTAAETKALNSILTKVGTLFRTIKKETLNGLSKANNEELNTRVNVYVNQKVRAGERIGNPKQFVAGLTKYINDYYGKEADKKKTQRGKDTQTAKRDSALAYFANNNKKEIERLFEMYNLLVDAKLMVISKLNHVDGLQTFLKTNKGFEVTGQEGFVAIDHMGKNSLKLVDRLQFSKANFSTEYIKGWEKK